MNNVIKQYNEANTSLGARKVCHGPEKVDLYPSEYIEAQRLMKSTIYASEIRQRLLLDGVLHLNDLPSNSQINKLSHFFDETGVIKTLGNRIYGSAPVGFHALEVQCYASNANCTVNLMHSITGVNFFNILDGPSNGMELLNVFDEALQ